LSVASCVTRLNSSDPHSNGGGDGGGTSGNGGNG